MSYYKIQNADGKQWVMPSKNMSVGMLLYQPMTWKGKALKKWFPLLNKLDWFGLIKNVLHVEIVGQPVSETILIKLQEIFNTKDIEYSVFNGTPSAHQKVTIQIYIKNKILGYCKITDNTELIDVFKHEEAYLDWLKKCGVKGVPECLCCQEIENGYWIFVQTTIKSKESVVHYKIGELKISFLHELANKTKKSILFKETEMYKWLKQIDKTGFKTPEIINAVKSVCAYYHSDDWVSFSAYHSDFTPWNMFVEDGNLFVFDWEYAGKTYIPNLDIIHYLIQTKIFESQASAEELYDMLFIQYWNILKNNFENPRIAVLAYLLDSLSKYASRDKGHETKDIIMLKKKRIKLIKLINESEGIPRR